MAIHYGYVTIPHATYDEWRNATNGEGYNFDYQYGCQCYDLAVEFWWNVGFPQGFPVSGVPGQGNTGNAYDIWTYRNYNVNSNGVTYFDLITNVNEIKRGDVLIFNYTSYNPYGHVAWADVDYSSWTPDPYHPYEFPVLSQNNGGTPDPSGGALTNIHGYDIRLFLGAFRYKEWESTPPTPPTPTEKKHHFPWVLYDRKLRENRQFQ